MATTFRVDGQDYDFDVDKLLNVELIAIERATGLTVNQWAAGLDAGSAVAVTGLVWVMRKRTEPTLKFEDVSFPMSTFELVPAPETVEVDVDPTAAAPGVAPEALPAL